MNLTRAANNTKTPSYRRFDSNTDGELSMEEVKALDFTIGTDSGSPTAEEYLTQFKRTFGRKVRNPYTGNSERGHITLGSFLKFITSSAIEDPLAVRSMLTKGGYSLSFCKPVGVVNEFGLSGSAGLTETSQRVQEEMLKEKEERQKKTYSANSLHTGKAAGKSKVAYDSLEKIRVIASRKGGFDLKVAFKKFDLDGNGTVDHDELKAVIEEICSAPDEDGKVTKIPKWEMDAIIELFDPNGDGSIDYAEFSWTFYNRRALTSKDASGGDGDGADGRNEAANSNATGQKRSKKKKDPDPVMPPPPKTSGFLKLSEKLREIVELTPRDERGVPLRDLVRQDKPKTKEEGGGSSRSVSHLREAVETARSKTSTKSNDGTWMKRSKSASDLTAMRSS